MGIVLTAPLGAVAIKWVGERILAASPESEHAALDALCDSRQIPFRERDGRWP